MTAFTPVGDFYREPTGNWTCPGCDETEANCVCDEPWVEAPARPLTDEQRAEAMARLNAAFARVVADKRRAA